MFRRLALLLLVVTAAAGLGSVACEGTKDFNFYVDGGGPAVDAGPCDVYTQTNCPAALKCTIEPDGGPVCGAKGSGANYAACTNDADCSAGTACVDLQFSGFEAGQHCYPFCDVDAGNTCPGGGTCLALSNIPEGFCDLALDAGP